MSCGDWYHEKRGNNQTTKPPTAKLYLKAENNDSAIILALSVKLILYDGNTTFHWDRTITAARISKRPERGTILWINLFPGLGQGTGPGPKII